MQIPVSLKSVPYDMVRSSFILHHIGTVTVYRLIPSTRLPYNSSFTRIFLKGIWTWLTIACSILLSMATVLVPDALQRKERRDDYITITSHRIYAVECQWCKILHEWKFSKGNVISNIYDKNYALSHWLFSVSVSYWSLNIDHASVCVTQCYIHYFHHNHKDER